MNLNYKMNEKNETIQSIETIDDKLEQVYVAAELGLHARPSGLIVGACKTYPFKINFSFNENEGYGTSVLSLLSLGVGSGDLVKVNYTLPDKNHENYVELVSKLNTLERYISDVVQGRTKDKFEDYLKN